MTKQYRQTRRKPSNVWHDAVFQRDFGACAAKKHDRRCRLRAEEAHHIVYRSHLHSAALWLIPNGIALSHVCHMLAHATHNQTLPASRLIEAVDCVNEVHRREGFPERPYFAKKAA